jgi:hypothetical protein
MCDEWMPCVELRITAEQFQQLPRQAAYSYTYYDGVAWISPRPRFYHALLDLGNLPPAPQAEELFEVRLLQPDDWDDLPSVFAAAFAGQLPFSGLSEETRLRAARQSLEQTRRGGDGPWITWASFVATELSGQVIGGLLTTLLPDADPTEWDSFCWPEPPPIDALSRGLGRRPTSSHLDLRGARLGRPGRRHRAVASGGPGPAPARLHPIGQHLSARQ